MRNDQVILIEDDLHAERAGFYRAFWADTVYADTMVTVIGYASPGGSHRTIRATVAEVRRMYPDAKIYRNGKEVQR